jgi:hypothetical protein
MNILPSIEIPTPFGHIKTRALETPPIRLPSIPDAHGKAALKQSIGADLIDLSDTVLDLIPGADIVGGILDPVRDSITAMHEKEIMGILTKEEYADYLDYNKIFPRSVAMARTMCFKQAEKPAAKVTKHGHGLAGILPMPPAKGPPLPAMLNIYWPKPETK